MKKKLTRVGSYPLFLSGLLIRPIFRPGTYEIEKILSKFDMQEIIKEKFLIVFRESICETKCSYPGSEWEIGQLTPPSLAPKSDNLGFHIFIVGWTVGRGDSVCVLLAASLTILGVICLSTNMKIVEFL